MDSQHFNNAWHNQTTLHPLGITAVLVLGVAMLCVQRRYATWPMILLACFIPSAQRLVVAGADFDLLRIMIIFGTLRIIIRNEYVGIVWNRLDAALVVWALCSSIIPLVRLGPDVLVNRLGYLYDALGMYLIFRCIVRSWEDISGIARGFMLASFPVMAFFAVEWVTGRNAFSFLGGVPQITEIRDGRLRCQGAFSHPILAGCFWAAVLPLMAVQHFADKKRLALPSCIAAMFIVVTCSSATPVMGVITAAIGAVLYFVQPALRIARWGVVPLLVFLHMVMNKPVWHLIARTSTFGGSSWHRFALLDGAIRHFNEWWFMGTSIGTGHWGHFTFDVTNYYIVQGIQGGVVQLLAFVVLIAFGFGHVGAQLRKKMSRAQKLTTWALGVALTVHAVNLFGVSYFGQIWVSWYMLLGILAALPTLRTISPDSAGRWQATNGKLQAIVPSATNIRAGTVLHHLDT